MEAGHGAGSLYYELACQHWNRAASVRGDLELGFRLARGTHRSCSFCELVSLIVRVSDTPADALHRLGGLATEYGWYAPVARPTATAWNVCWPALSQRAHTSRTLDQFLLLTAFRALVDTVPGARLLRINLDCPRTDEGRTQWNGIPIAYAQPQPSLSFSPETAALPMAGKEPILATLLVHAAQALLASHKAEASSQVQRALLCTPRSHPRTLVQVARTLGVSTRTLQRQLREEGTSFREIAKSVQDQTLH